ncbi:hypothetical protein RCL1_006695 [Eukaryota sp. TZLM3-RCL]
MDPRSSTPIRKNQKNDHRPRSSIPSRQGLQDPHQHRRFRLGRRRSDMARNASLCPCRYPPNRQKGDPSLVLQQDPPKLTKELEHHTERTVRDHIDPYRIHSVRLPPKPKAHDLYGPQEHRFLVFCSGKEPYREAMDPHPGRIFN